MPKENNTQGSKVSRAASAYDRAKAAEYFDPPTPSEPPLLARSRELLGYLQELAMLQADIWFKLLTPRVPAKRGGDDGPNSCGDKILREPSLEELLATNCSLAASLVGEQKTILARL